MNFHLIIFVEVTLLSSVVIIYERKIIHISSLLCLFLVRPCKQLSERKICESVVDFSIRHLFGEVPVYYCGHCFFKKIRSKTTKLYRPNKKIYSLLKGPSAIGCPPKGNPKQEKINHSQEYKNPTISKPRTKNPIHFPQNKYPLTKL